MQLWLTPWLSNRWPPTTIRRPSGRKVWPEQNRLTGVPSFRVGWFLVSRADSGRRIQHVGLAGVIVEGLEVKRAKLLATAPVENLARRQQMRVDRDILQVERLRPLPNFGWIGRRNDGFPPRDLAARCS